ncbi:efflux RND transporter periplasmic adaptor subunit [Paraglaciecola aquimarina]|uniref:Efflux RND transporter periplasmic adaptor subunit n=1 Tax=Paraglaciecola aquimarina TaxID=1235557 RepID=A0ABU3SU75_9ALTE|nr:efflux RND transporter periplasmic adaptor subunit [Paraglaciecola aquimarina]MDU0353555.1 efflux RND transporter periplasmic adaptor subunit [Paraglaciecola aquimarina]
MKKTWMKGALPLLILVVGFAGLTAIKASAEGEEEKNAVDTRPTVKIETAIAQDYQVQITSYGEVAPLESTMLSAQVSGEVISWHPNFVSGGLVLRGDTLFNIEKDTYEAALLQAEANLTLAQSQLIEEQARADVAKREAKGLASNKISDLYLRKPQLLSAQAAVKSAQSRLKIALRDLDNCVVKAPYDALIVSRNIGVGQYVTQGTQIAQIYNIETAEISFPIAGFDREFLPLDIAQQKATVRTKGYDPIEREATISRDLGIIDQDTRMSQLVVRVADPYSVKSNLPPLKFGHYVEVTFGGETLSQVYRLPQTLVNNRIIWVLDEEQQMQPKRVNILREEGTYFLISEGLQDQDKLITTLPEYPQKGMKVKIAEPEPDLVVQQ